MVATKTIKSEELSFTINLSLDKPKVKRYLKFGNLKAVEDKIRNGLNLANELIHPQAIYKITDSNLQQLKEFNSPRPLHGTKYLAFGVSTVGDDIADKVDELMNEGHYTLSNILDSLGSAAVNITSDLLAERILTEAHSLGLNTTRAFQPGSGSINWKINNQRLIFDNLNTSKIDVTLTPTFTMLPKKSNSFVIGLDPDIKQVSHLFSCAGCDRLDCPVRDVPPSSDN